MKIGSPVVFVYMLEGHKALNCQQVIVKKNVKERKMWVEI